MATPLSKSEVRKLYTQAREAKMWAGEQIATAAECASEDDVEGFQRCMAEAGRLALIAAKRLKEARAASEQVSA